MSHVFVMDVPNYPRPLLSPTPWRTLNRLRASHAPEAIDVFAHRIQRHLSGSVAVLPKLDAVVFTGGIGEHAVPFRARVCRDLVQMGLELDVEAHERHAQRIRSTGTRVTAGVVPKDEEGVIARHTLALFNG